VHLVGFIIRVFHDARSPERQILYPSLTTRATSNSSQRQKTVTRKMTEEKMCHMIIKEMSSVQQQCGLPRKKMDIPTRKLHY